ncbi:MAG: DUF192 domain-containing protein [Candidatus Omnitrophota bacterium]
MKIFNATKGCVIADEAQIAASWSSRLKGLLGRRELKGNEALVIKNCNSIHMFFMRFAIDAIFIDGKDCVVGCVRNIRPFRVSPIFWKASCVIECPIGTIESSKTEIGDLIKIEEP